MQSFICYVCNIFTGSRDYWVDILGGLLCLPHLRLLLKISPIIKYALHIWNYSQYQSQELTANYNVRYRKTIVFSISNLVTRVWYISKISTGLSLKINLDFLNVLPFMKFPVWPWLVCLLSANYLNESIYSSSVMKMLM